MVRFFCMPFYSFSLRLSEALYTFFNIFLMLDFLRHLLPVIFFFLCLDKGILSQLKFNIILDPSICNNM